MYVIGIDPHRGSHAAAVLDDDERVRAVLRLPADRPVQRLIHRTTSSSPSRFGGAGCQRQGRATRRPTSTHAQHPAPTRRGVQYVRAG